MKTSEYMRLKEIVKQTFKMEFVSDDQRKAVFANIADRGNDDDTPLKNVEWNDRVIGGSKYKQGYIVKNGKNEAFLQYATEPMNRGPYSGKYPAMIRDVLSEEQQISAFDTSRDAYQWLGKQASKYVVKAAK